jgi:TRAP-type mannitol/chloroaromatic compound transport system permease small subunit
MRVLEQVLRIIALLNEWAGRLFSYLALWMMFSVTYEDVAPYIFNRPTVWSMEVNQYMLCGYIALTGGYVMLHGSHVTVDIVHERFGVRTRAFLDLLTSSALFSFIAVLIWTSGIVAREAWEYGEHSETLLALPLFPSKVVIPIGGVLLLLQGAAKFARDIRVVVSGGQKEQSGSALPGAKGRGK